MKHVSSWSLLDPTAASKCNEISNKTFHTNPDLFSVIKHIVSQSPVVNLSTVRKKYCGSETKVTTFLLTQATRVKLYLGTLLC